MVGLKIEHDCILKIVTVENVEKVEVSQLHPDCISRAWIETRQQMAYFVQLSKPTDLDSTKTRQDSGGVQTL